MNVLRDKDHDSWGSYGATSVLEKLSSEFGGCRSRDIQQDLLSIDI